MGAGKKKAARIGAPFVFVDESGLMMGPSLKRSGAPVGHTPVLIQRGRNYTKVSVIGALVVSPGRDRVQGYFRLHPGANIDALRTRDFLRQLLKEVASPFLLVWDRSRYHRAGSVKACIHAHALHSLFLPPYAAELNPVEYLWQYLKNHSLANHPFFDTESLTDTARRPGRSIQRKENLLRSFIRHSPLSLRLRLRNC